MPRLRILYPKAVTRDHGLCCRTGRTGSGEFEVAGIALAGRHEPTGRRAEFAGQGPDGLRRAAKKVDGTFENQRYSPAGLFRFVFALAAGMLVLGTSVANAADTAPQSAESATIDFNQDIRPILSNHCFACHGPDEEKRDSGLRLDTEEGLFEVVSRSDTDDSELWARVSSDDEEAQMPPPSFHKPLTDDQKAKLKTWIEEGAEYRAHWSFAPPQADPIAATQESSAIDYLIAKRAEAAGLTLNGPEDPRRLFRRLTFDLTGLPPTPEQTSQFLADTSPEAYEKAVDRLLASPQYGEHMARFWLDLTRYGDTHGLHLDNYREMWPYRDWVIRAFNDNMPFDQFGIEQLAGDLLPNATLDQKIASGYNRLNVTTSEGGSIYDEVFFRNVVDRVDAFGTVFLGLTTQCSTCHDHKFDPITQRDYYSLYAFFNSLDGRALDGNVKDHPPNLPVPQPSDIEQIEQVNAALAALALEARQPIDSVDSEQARWEAQLVENKDVQWQILHPDKLDAGKDSTLELEQTDTGIIKLGGKTPATATITLESVLPAQEGLRLVRLEVPTDTPESLAGLAANGNAVLSEIEIETKSEATGNDWLPVKFAYGEADFEQPDGKFALRFAYDGKSEKAEGWAIGGHQKPGPRVAWFATRGLLSEGGEARLRVRLKFESQFSEHLFGQIRLSVSDQIPQATEGKRLQQSDWQLAGPFPVESPSHAYARQIGAVDYKTPPTAETAVRYRDQDFPWQPHPQFNDTIASDLPVVADQPSVILLHRSITAPTDQQATLLLGTFDGVQVWLNGTRLAEVRGERPLVALESEYKLDLKKGENSLYLKVVNHSGSSGFSAALRSPAVVTPPQILATAKIPAEQRTVAQTEGLRSYYRQAFCLHPDWLALKDEQAGLVKRLEEINKAIPITLVWKETEEPRKAHIMLRGLYDSPGEEVTRRVPEFLPPLPESAPNNRLGLAQWLFTPSHPLTSRVIVNRFWQQVFGTGIVKTSEDFGAQGDVPSHPKLLDHLAVDFQASGWDVKRMMKQIVMSDTYRRSSQVTPEILAKDPTNRLLARGPRFRLDAEMLRDQALAVSGLLIEEMGGPSVKPPQPDGLWFAVGYSGSNTVRFTADTGSKIYRRSLYTFWKRTSPPPQLSTFDAPSRESCTARRERTNTPLQALLLLNEPQYMTAAKRLASRANESEGTDPERLETIFQTIVARSPSDAEQKELLTLLGDLNASYEADPAAAKALVESENASLAAWTVLVNTLLNLDEVITK